MSAITDFYGKLSKNPNGIDLYDVLNFDDEKLEHTHNYIQWLFPMVEPDYWNRETPKLTDDDIVVFKCSREMKERVVRSLIFILKFWGLRLSIRNYIGIMVRKGDDYEIKSKQWQTGMNHNFLRITRVLHCLNDLGMFEISRAFHKFLKEIVAEDPSKFNENSVSCWDLAMVKNMKGKSYFP